MSCCLCLVCECRRVVENGLYHCIVIEYANGVNILRYVVTEHCIICYIVEDICASVLVSIKEGVCMRVMIVVAGINKILNRTNCLIEVSVYRGVVCVKEVECNRWGEIEGEKTVI